MKATAQGGIAFAHQLGYKQALADAKAELHNLLSSMARNKLPQLRYTEHEVKECDEKRTNCST